MVLSKGLIASAGISVAVLMWFMDFLSHTVPTPIGVLLGLAVLPTAEASKAAAELFDSLRKRVHVKS